MTLYQIPDAGKRDVQSDIPLQKTFCEDFLTKKIKAGQSEVSQHYVKNNHEATIDPKTSKLSSGRSADGPRARIVTAVSTGFPKGSSAATAADGMAQGLALARIAQADRMVVQPDIQRRDLPYPHPPSTGHREGALHDAAQPAAGRTACRHRRLRVGHRKGP